MGYARDNFHRETAPPLNTPAATRRALHLEPVEIACGPDTRFQLTAAQLQALDHLLHFIGGQLCAPGQRTYFIGHNCKATTLFTRACRLNGSIQRQQIGLLGNALYHRNNAIDAVRALHQTRNFPRCGVHLACHVVHFSLQRLHQHHAVFGGVCRYFGLNLGFVRVV